MFLAFIDPHAPQKNKKKIKKISQNVQAAFLL